MVIDIVDMSDEAYQNLSPVQLAMVRAAQAKKNDIESERDNEKQETFLLLLAQGVARSSMLQSRYEEIDKAAE